MTAYKSIFAICVAFIAYVVITQIDQISIDTSLKDLAPQFANNPETRAAVDHVSGSLEKRFVLLIDSKNPSNQIPGAIKYLASNIDAIDQVQIAPNTEQVLDLLVEFYKPYRFQLLSNQQRKLLKPTAHSDVEKGELQRNIAEQAHQQLFQLNTKPRLVPFIDDPLGWQSEYLLSRLLNLSENNNIAKNYLVFTLSNKRLSLENQQSLSTRIEKIIQSVSSQYDVTVYRSGVFFFATEAASQSKKEITFITSVSMISVFLLLILVFRNIGPVVLPFISIAFGVAFAMAVTQIVFNGIHVLTIVFGASLIGVVIDYSLHFFYHKSSHSKHDINQNEVKKSHRQLLNALLLSLATSLIGYAALSFSSLDALKKVALFSCCGLFMAWLSVVCLGDWMTRDMHSPRERCLQAIVTVIFKPLRTINLTGAISILTCILLTGSAIALIAPPVSDDPRLFFKPSPELLSQEAYVSQRVNDFEPGRYLLLKSKSSKSQNSRSLHDIANEFNQKISKFKDLQASQFVSLIDWVPSAEQQQKNYQLLSSLYLQDGAIEQLLTKLGLDQTTALTLRHNYTQADGLLLDLATTAETFKRILPPLWLSINTSTNQQELAFMLIKKGTNTEPLKNIAKDINGLEYINTLESTALVLKEQRQSASLLLMLAYLFIALLLVIRFKSLTAIWMVSIPLASTGILLIIFFITGSTLNLFHTMALFLVLGLGMDYSIFVKEMRGNISITHQSIFLSAITSLLSFGLLAISSTPVVSAFGVTLLIGNLSNLIGAFLYSEQLLRYEQ